MTRRFHLALGVSDLNESLRHYTTRLGSDPVLVVPNVYALFRTEQLNLSLRVQPSGSAVVRHVGFEREDAVHFESELDVNGLLWETFSFGQQLQEIEEAWPRATHGWSVPPADSTGKTTLEAVEFRPPLLTTERVLLRGWEPSDEAAIFEYASDPEVARFMAWDRHRSREEAKFFLNVIVAQSYEKRQLNYALCRRDEPQRALGGIGLEMSSDPRVMELGYVLHRAAWGQGLVPEAGRLLLDYASATTAVERIFAPILAPNDKSRRAAEKMGLRFEGILRSSIALRGQRWDQAIYSALRSELSGSI